MTQFKHGQEHGSRVNRARRHFLGLAAAVTTRAAMLGGLAATVLPSAAKAQNRGRGRGPGGGGMGPPGGGQGGGRGPACFLRGTAILTPAGERPIEDLQVGDLVQTMDGRALPVRWIGRHTYRKSRRRWPDQVVPVRVSRGALADGIPRRDLFLSPTHCLFVDGILVRVKELVNGTSVAPAAAEDLERIEYFNILLESHEVILAEGAPAETFLLQGRNYEVFANFVEYERLYPGGGTAVLSPYAPVAGYEGGRQHLKALLAMAAAPFIPVRDPVQDACRKLAARAETLAR